MPSLQKTLRFGPVLFKLKGDALVELQNTNLAKFASSDNARNVEIFNLNRQCRQSGSRLE